MNDSFRCVEVLNGFMGTTIAELTKINFDSYWAPSLANQLFCMLNLMLFFGDFDEEQNDSIALGLNVQINIVYIHYMCLYMRTSNPYTYSYT